MEEIRIKIDDEHREEFEKLGNLLYALNIDHVYETEHKESMSGFKYEETYLKITYDYMEAYRKVHRSSGRNRKVPSRLLSVREVRKMIDEIGAEAAAKKLGYSRRTLFRRIAEAEKREDNLIW